MVQWKGGVGKSTLAVHLAAALGAVLVDLEPWGGATTWWAGTHASEVWQAPGPAPVLHALRTGRAPRPRSGGAGRPPLVPSHEQLLTIFDGAPTQAAAWAWTPEGQPALMVPTPGGPRRLSDAIRDGLRQWAGDWGCHVVVDTPGGYGALADGAAAAADVVILPITLDQWSVPALWKFMANYGPRVRCGLVVPNRVRDRVSDGQWAELLTSEGVIRPPFQLGPAVQEGEILHSASRPLTSGPTPGVSRAAVLEQIAAVAAAAVEAAESSHG
jgi:cellulose biosynthesis protein BcsQ